MLNVPCITFCNITFINQLLYATTVYTKSHTNFHSDVFRHLLMPSSEISVHFAEVLRRKLKWNEIPEDGISLRCTLASDAANFRQPVYCNFLLKTSTEQFHTQRTVTVGTY